MPVAPLSDQAGGVAAPRRDRRDGRPQSVSSVTVVIPSLSGGESLLHLVGSLSFDGGSLDVIVADNGLAPCTRSRLADSGAQVIAMGRNLGFGTAINRVAATVSSDVLVVLNDDIDPLPGFLDTLVAAVDDGADMVAGVLLQQRAPSLVETAGIEIDRTLLACDYLHNEPVARLDEPLAAPLGPSGGAAAYRLSAFREVDGFDESFFAYCEDVDLAIRLRAIGKTCALARGARAVHLSSATLGYRSLAKANLVGFSRGLLLRKYRVLRDLRSAPAALAIEAVAVLLLARQHRSLRPGLARVRGWRSCRTRAAAPPASDITVGLLDAWRRRYVRGRMPASTAAS